MFVRSLFGALLLVSVLASLLACNARATPDPATTLPVPAIAEATTTPGDGVTPSPSPSTAPAETATPLPVEVEQYDQRIIAFAERLHELFAAIGDGEFSGEAWENEIKTQVALLHLDYETIRRTRPPAERSDFHQQLVLRATRICDEAIVEYARVIDEVDREAQDEAFAAVKQCETMWGRRMAPHLESGFAPVEGAASGPRPAPPGSRERLPLRGCEGTSVGLVPLTDLGTETYQGYEGGLYPGGSNVPPQPHQEAGLAIARTVVPLDASGGADSQNGRIVMLSIGMSNTSQEFGAFQQLAREQNDVNPQLRLVNGAQPGWVAGKIARGDATPFWAEIDRRMGVAEVTDEQVQVIWLKLVSANPTQEFEPTTRRLQQDIEMIIATLHERYPNLKMIYLSSRIYAGYANSYLSPEPYAYESGFAMKWLIEKQLSGEATLNFDPARGEVQAPWLAWGPYLWADGTTPRSDGLTWQCDELQRDGVHPSEKGMAKVAGILLDFLRSEPTAAPWFLAEGGQ